MNNQALSLFSGIGAHDLGLSWAGWETKLFCEIDPYCQTVLRKHWPDVHVVSDVKSLTGARILSRFKPGLLEGGFPCQDISLAGKGEGLDGARSGLFFETIRLLSEMRECGHRVPWLFFENVPALFSRGYDRVASALESEGYECWPFVVGASDLGAPHKRQRVWIVCRLANASCAGLAPEHIRGYTDGNSGYARRPRATGNSTACRESAQTQFFNGTGHSTFSGAELADGNNLRQTTLAADGIRELQREGRVPEFRGRVGHVSQPMANADQTGRGELRRGEPVQEKFPAPQCLRDGWPSGPSDAPKQWEWPNKVDSAGTKEIESLLGLSVAGPSKRVARLKALGNCNPPYVPYLIGKAIMEWGVAANE